MIMAKMVTLNMSSIGDCMVIRTIKLWHSSSNNMVDVFMISLVIMVTPAATTVVMLYLLHTVRSWNKPFRETEVTNLAPRPQLLS